MRCVCCAGAAPLRHSFVCDRGVGAGAGAFCGCGGQVPISRRGRGAALAEAGNSKALTSMLLLAGPLFRWFCVFTLHKDHPLTMEAPRGSYPVAAVKFMQQHSLNGNILTFFDWGDMTIFELPKSKVSIDGRLDACYSRALINAHWQLYNGEGFDASILPLERADFALLPSNLAGTAALAKAPGWQVVYYDSTATLLARDAGRLASEAAIPLRGSDAESSGREAFPSKRPGSLSGTKNAIVSASAHALHCRARRKECRLRISSQQHSLRRALQ